MFRRLAQHRHLVRFNAKLLAAVASLATLSGLLQALVLVLVVRLIAGLADSADVAPGSLSETQTLLLAAALVTALALVDVANAWTQATLQSRSQRDCRQRVLAAYASASHEEQTRLPRGEMQQVVNGLTNQAAQAAEQLGVFVSSGLSFLVLVLWAVVLSPAIAGFVAVGVALLLLVLRPVVRAGRTAGDAHTQSQRQLGARWGERLELALEANAFGVSGPSVTGIGDQIDDSAERLRWLRFTGRLGSVVYRIGSLVLVLALLVVLLAWDQISTEAWAAAVVLLLRSMSYGQAAQNGYQTISQLLPVIDQLADEYHRWASSSRLRPGGVVPETVALELASVGLTYPNGTVALSGVDLRVEPGEFVGLIGPSGAGKSSAMALLLGLRAPTVGTVTVGGVDLGDVESRWWHRAMAYVPQESKLVSGSVREAVRFHRDWISDDDVVAAVRAAQIEEDIEAWVDGYDTDVGQVGEQLSGGQRQRLAIARALAGSPKLLLLDEPTSSLDPDSERLINDTLQAVSGEVTVVAIAHRAEALRGADRVYRLDRGQLASR